MSFWDGCEYVERVKGKVGGRPVIKGTRIEPDLLVTEAELGRTPKKPMKISRLSR